MCVSDNIINMYTLGRGLANLTLGGGGGAGHLARWTFRSATKSAY